MIEKLKTVPRLYLVVGAIALVIALTLGWWFYGTRVWNGIGNWMFHRQINAERSKVDKELQDAAKQKQALEQTLLELKQAKEDLAQAKADRELAEKLFYDQSKTSAEKVAEYKKALATAPTHTDTTGITGDDLCARASASNSSPAIIAALCAK